MAGSNSRHRGTVAISGLRLRKSATKHLLSVSLILLSLFALRLSAHDKKGIQYGMGLIVNLPFPASEVEQVLQEVVQNGIIRGTKEYNKDQYITGAEGAESTKVFPAWTEGGKVFYKVKLNTLDPRNFKDSQDVGTLAVRYVVQAQSEKNCVLRIDAVFVEDFRRTSHASDGSVEGAEYKDIHDRLDAIEAIKEETAESLKEKQRKLAAKNAGTLRPDEGSSSSRDAENASGSPDSSSSAAANQVSQNQVSQNVGAGASSSSPHVAQNLPAQRPAEPEPISQDQRLANRTTADPIPPSQERPPAGQTPDERLKYLRQQVERLVKAPGAALKSAPFHTASTLQSLPTGTEVLIVISTPYWLGVETHDGQHGWILRDQLEQVP